MHSFFICLILPLNSISIWIDFSSKFTAVEYAKNIVVPYHKYCLCYDFATKANFTDISAFPSKIYSLLRPD